MFEIVNNVARIATPRRREGGSGAKPKYPLGALKVSQGFTVDTDDEKVAARIRAAVYSFMRSHTPKRFRTYRTETGVAVERIA